MLYKGYEIPKFKSEKFVPRHVIAEYYRDSKDRIDRLIRIEEQKKTQSGNTETVNESLNSFFDYIEE